jgi:hypothetical protein
MVATAMKKIAAMPVDDIEDTEFMPLGSMPQMVDKNRAEEVATYVSQMTGEMAAMARTARLDLLAYFLEMARIEANANSGKINEPH